MDDLDALMEFAENMRSFDPEEAERRFAEKLESWNPDEVADLMEEGRKLTLAHEESFEIIVTTLTFVLTAMTLQGKIDVLTSMDLVKKFGGIIQAAAKLGFQWGWDAAKLSETFAFEESGNE